MWNVNKKKRMFQANLFFEALVETYHILRIEIWWIFNQMFWDYELKNMRKSFWLIQYIVSVINEMKKLI